MRRISLFSSVLLLVLATFTRQCSDPHERYEDPPWLGGSNIETLEGEGNYDIFLALMDKAEYRVSIENQLFTLFVPSDSAFEAYFDKIGISSVDELSTDAAEELFGQHILINPRSREQLMFEYAWGELQDPKGEYGTLFHRKETYAVPLEYKETVRYNPEFKDQELLLYRRTTMIPLFTTEFFEDYFGDPKGSDYLFMYPNSSWSGIQWHDAMVTEAEVRTSSGFIYYLDRVVEPVETIETYLRDNQDQFGVFYDIAQRFATYVNPSFNEDNERRYRKSYSQISDFADEWGPESSSAEAKMLYSFTAFIPYDNVLQDFLDNTVLQSYSSLDSVPQLFLVYLLQSHLNTYLSLPSKIEDRFLNYYGDEITIDVNADIGGAQGCGNGVIYFMNSLLEPNAFTCVPGDIFYQREYTTFLYALEESGVLNSLTRPEITMTLFAPSNAELLEYGIRHNEVDGDIIIEIMGSDGVWNEMEVLDIQDFVEDYIHAGNYEDFLGEGFIRMASDNYLYFNNSEIIGGGNQVEGDVSLVVEKVPSNRNGNLFYIDNSIKAPYNAAEYILNDPELSDFGTMLDTLNLIDSIQADYEIPGVRFPRINFMNQLNQWTVFAPTNQALADAVIAGLLPTDEDELKEFVYYHFVRGTTVFDDGEFSGTLPTHRKDAIIGSDIFYESVDMSNAIHSLTVTDMTGQDVTVEHTDANRLIEGGSLHKINSVLLSESAK
jgi:uncharacterized surface protein with fasciclin (FAS1) repeats